MGAHLIDGEFQSDKYPTCPRGKVPLSVKDPGAQDLLWKYAQRRRAVDAEFSEDLEEALIAAGFPVVYVVRTRRPHSGDSYVTGEARGSRVDAATWIDARLSEGSVDRYEIERVPARIS